MNEYMRMADRMYDLENQMKQLEKENAELKQANEGKVVEHFEAFGQCRDSRRIAELEAEIAELKSGCGMCYRKDKEQLTKAKEIIKDFLLMAEVEHLKDRYETVDEAEQFLSEVEK